jgi:hypothetical protein
MIDARRGWGFARWRRIGDVGVGQPDLALCASECEQQTWTEIHAAIATRSSWTGPRDTTKYLRVPQPGGCSSRRQLANSVKTMASTGPDQLDILTTIAHFAVKPG